MNPDQCQWIAGPPMLPKTIGEAIDWIEEHNPNDAYRYYISGFVGAMFSVSLQQMRDLAVHAQLWDGAHVTLYEWNVAPWLTIRHCDAGAGITMKMRFDG